MHKILIGQKDYKDAHAKLREIFKKKSTSSMLNGTIAAAHKLILKTETWSTGQQKIQKYAYINQVRYTYTTIVRTMQT